MKRLFLILLLVGCGGRRVSETLLTKAQEIPKSGVSEVVAVAENPAYLIALPWMLGLAGLILFLFAIYTPSKKDDVAGGVLFLASMVVAYNGVQIIKISEWILFIGIGLAVVGTLAFWAKGHVEKNYTNKKAID
jgi:hypothetical protein